MKVSLGSALFLLSVVLAPSATVVTPTMTYSGGGTPHQSSVAAALDGTGLSTTDLNTGGALVPTTLPTHSANYTQGVSWLSTPTELVFDLGGVIDTESIIFYNYAEAGQTDRGLSSFTLEVSSDGSSYTSLGTMNFSEAVISEGQITGETVAFAQSGISHVRFSNLVNHSSGTDSIIGFSEIRFTQVPEPSSVFLLSLGALSFLNRRKR